MRPARETAAIVFCRQCDWEQPGMCAGRCPRCNANIFWVRYEVGKEDQAARDLITLERDWHAHETRRAQLKAIGRPA